MILLVSLSAASASSAVPGSEPLSLTGSFTASPLPPFAHAEVVHGAIYGERPRRSTPGGRAESGVFVAPRQFECEFAGFPALPGMLVFLEDAKDPNQKIALAIARSSGYVWRARQWRLPSSWQGRRVRFIVEDYSRPSKESWVAFTLPHEFDTLDPARLIYAARMVLSIPFEFGLLLLPGIAAVLWFGRKGSLGSASTLTILLIGSGVAAFVTFFAFLPTSYLGRCVGPAVIFLSGFLAIRLWKTLAAHLEEAGIRVLVVWLSVAVLISSATFLFRNGDVPGDQAQLRFFKGQMPPDNLLPDILAEKIYSGEPFRPAFFGDIQSGDRPPLQTGFVLFQRGFWLDPDLQYQLLGVILQTAWIPALWVFLRRFGVGGAPMLAAIAVPALSHFAFIHEVFVWPKLLSAAFGLLALSSIQWFGAQDSPVRESLRQDFSRQDMVIGGLSLALALLCHSGVVFTAIGFGLLLILLRAAPLRWAAGLIGIAALVFLPWILYQRFYDPPGDALLKLHLAGVVDRNRSLLSLVVSSYAHLGFSGWLATKWINLKYLFWGGAITRPFHGLSEDLVALSELIFFSLVPCLGLVNLGALPRLLHPRRPQLLPDRMMLAAFASFLVWFSLMFAPESTVVHQGSFLMMLLFFVALTLYLAEFSLRAAAALIAWQVVEFLFFAIPAKPLIDHSDAVVTDTFPDFAMFLLFFATLAAMIVGLVREWRSPGAFSGLSPSS